MHKQSAGILLYRYAEKGIQFFLVHPGGPFWKNKDAGAWSIPKGEFLETESALDAAIRELTEETGIVAKGNFIELGFVKLKSGKKVYAWALKADADTHFIACDSFIKIEWPPRSGKHQSIPEVDKGEWFFIEEAKVKINPAQTEFISELIKKISD